MKKKSVQVFPSILSADFGKLALEAGRIEEANADGIHIDIMDGHFVPNLTLGPKAVGAIREKTSLFLDVHLMIYNPFDYIEAFVKAGANRITFHFEATEDVQETLDFIHTCNIEAALAFRPETSFSMIPKWLDKIDMILVMTVSPGFGGQVFIPKVVEKIKQIREISSVPIQVDGGIDPKTAKLCVDAGATILVSGHYLFSQKSLKEGVELLRV